MIKAEGPASISSPGDLLRRWTGGQSQVALIGRLIHGVASAISIQIACDRHRPFIAERLVIGVRAATRGGRTGGVPHVEVRGVFLVLEGGWRKLFRPAARCADAARLSAQGDAIQERSSGGRAYVV